MLLARAFKQGVIVIQVNPAYTSIIGRINFAKRYGLSVHLAAALCIARRYPSCNTRSMVETAAHLTENLIPAVPVRQWVISFPKRIRNYLQTHEILQTVLRIVADEVRKRIIACSPQFTGAQFGAISFIQRFGTTLNLHPHFHLVVADGVFEMKEGSFHFHEAFLTPDDIADTQDNIRKRVLKLFERL